MPLSTFLNGRAPTRLRGLMMLSLSDVGTWLTRTYTDDTGGGATATWGTAGTAIPCRIDPLGGNGRSMTAGRVDERSTHLITVPPGTDVSTSDRFAVSGRGTFEVTAARERTAEWARLFEVIET